MDIVQTCIRVSCLLLQEVSFKRDLCCAASSARQWLNNERAQHKKDQVAHYVAMFVTISDNVDTGDKVEMKGFILLYDLSKWYMLHITGVSGI